MPTPGPQQADQGSAGRARPPRCSRPAHASMAAQPKSSRARSQPAITTTAMTKGTAARARTAVMTRAPTAVQTRARQATSGGMDRREPPGTTRGAVISPYPARPRPRRGPPRQGDGRPEAAAVPRGSRPGRFLQQADTVTALGPAAAPLRTGTRPLHQRTPGVQPAGAISGQQVVPPGQERGRGGPSQRQQRVSTSASHNASPRVFCWASQAVALRSAASRPVPAQALFAVSTSSTSSDEWRKGSANTSHTGPPARACAGAQGSASAALQLRG